MKIMEAKHNNHKQKIKKRKERQSTIEQDSKEKMRKKCRN